MDMILKILSGESYSGIHALWIYLCALININKLSGAVAREIVELTMNLA
jgi:hypothetical protein